MFISKSELKLIRSRLTRVEDISILPHQIRRVIDMVDSLYDRLELLEKYLNIEVTTTPKITKYEPIVQRDTTTT